MLFQMISSQLIAQILLIPDIPFQYNMLVLHLDSIHLSILVIHSIFCLMQKSCSDTVENALSKTRQIISTSFLCLENELSKRTVKLVWHELPLVTLLHFILYSIYLPVFILSFSSKLSKLLQTEEVRLIGLHLPRSFSSLLLNMGTSVLIFTNIGCFLCLRFGGLSLPLHGLYEITVHLVIQILVRHFVQSSLHSYLFFFHS